MRTIANKSLRVRAEFDEKTKGFTYDPLIPMDQKPNPLGVR